MPTPTNQNSDCVAVFVGASLPERPTVFLYTPEGRRRIAKAITATLKHRGWSRRDLWRQIGEDRVSHGTINDYAAGRRANLNDWVLELIAPHIFKVRAFHGDIVKINPEETYSDWRQFARLGTSRFMEPRTKFSVFLQQWQQQKQVDDQQFKAAIAQRTELTAEAFAEICEGIREPDNTELLWIGSVVTDKDDRPYRLEELQAIRDGGLLPEWLQGQRESNGTSSSGSNSQ